MYGRKRETENETNQMEIKIKVYDVQDKFKAFNYLLNGYIEELRSFDNCQDNIINKVTISDLKVKIEYYNKKLNSLMEQLKKDDFNWKNKNLEIEE